MEVDNEMFTRASQQDTSLCRVCLIADHSNRCIFRENWGDHPGNANASKLSTKLRLCGGVEVCFARLMYEPRFGFAHSSLQITRRFLCIQVLEDDGLPTGICLECVTRVNVAYELREQCQKADMKLRKLYGKALRRSGGCVPTKVLAFPPIPTFYRGHVR